MRICKDRDFKIDKTNSGFNLDYQKLLNVITFPRTFWKKNIKRSLYEHKANSISDNTDFFTLPFIGNMSIINQIVRRSDILT